MKIRTIIFAAFIACAILSSCNPDPKSNASNSNTIVTAPPVTTPTTLTGAAKAESYASDMCGCLQPVLDITQKVQDLVATGRRDSADKLRPQMELIKANTDKCGQKVEAKYGKLTTEEGKASIISLQKNCPKVANFLREMMKAQMQDRPNH